MTSTPDDIELLSVAEAARRAMVSASTISRWMRKGNPPLPFIPNGKEKLIRLDDLQARLRLEFKKKRSSRVVRALLDSVTDDG